MNEDKTVERVEVDIIPPPSNPQTRLTEQELAIPLSDRDRLKLLMRVFVLTGIVPPKILVWDLVSIFDKEIDKQPDTKIAKALELAKKFL